ncbi:hypothetical protein LTR94_037509, partial [Friedmanniomyces endolithicus]
MRAVEERSFEQLAQNIIGEEEDEQHLRALDWSVETDGQIRRDAACQAERHEGQREGGEQERYQRKRAHGLGGPEWVVQEQA